jgi:hypothetical protein
MKKVLLSAVAVSTVLGFSNAKATTITTTTYGTIPNSVQLDTRTLPRMVQEGLRNSAPAIQGALAAAEAAGSSFTDAMLGDITEGSFVGIDTMAIDDDNHTLTFTVDLNELNSNITADAITVKLKYAPVADAYGQITGWTCTSNASKSDLGTNFIAMTDGADGTLDPLTSGLGWPYAGCVVGTVS